MRFGVGFLGDSGPNAAIVLGMKTLRLYSFASFITLWVPIYETPGV